MARTAVPTPGESDTIKAVRRGPPGSEALQVAVPGFKQSSRLLDLPPEIKNMIYEMVVIEDEIKVTEDTGWVALPQQEPAMLKVCQQIRDEATPVFYGANIFRSSNVVTLLNS